MTNFSTYMDKWVEQTQIILTISFIKKNDKDAFFLFIANFFMRHEFILVNLISKLFFIFIVILK